MTIELFEQLLNLQEGNLLDFKKTAYDFFSKDDDVQAKLIKDIISFGNTIRDTSAFIIMGIEETAGKLNLVGLTNLPDEASIQQAIKNKIMPEPEISIHRFTYKGLLFGIIEIPVWGYNHPLQVSVKLKGLLPKELYYRSGSSNTEADHGRVNQIYEWHRTVREAQKPLTQPISYNAVDDYIPRTIQASQDVSTIGSSFFGKETLLSAIGSHPRLALLGWGLTGKTTELKQLASELTKDPANYVFLITLDNNLDVPIEKHISDIERLDLSKTFILLDGLDEVVASDFEKARRLILQFSDAFDACRIVVSCRTNFYTISETNDKLSTLSHFRPYQLNPLDDHAIESYIDRKLGNDKTSFVTMVHRRNMKELLATPYYLVKLVKEFSGTANIAANKTELFGKEIRELIYADASKSHHGEEELMQEVIFQLLQKVAFVMEVQGLKHIKTTDLLAMLSNGRELALLKSAASIFHSTAERGKVWRFINNSTQEYLTATVLAKMPLKEIRNIIGIGPSYQQINPKWRNTLSFLISLLHKDSGAYKKLFQLLLAHNQQIVITLDPELVKKKHRFALIKKILLDYKAEKRYLNWNVYPIQELARFSEFEEVFDYLINALQDIGDVPFTSNAIQLTNFYSLGQFPQYRQLFKSIYENILTNGDPALHHLAIAGYCTLFQLTEQEFSKMFDRFKDSTNTYVRYQLFYAIKACGQQNSRVAYLMSEAKKMITNEVATTMGEGEKKEPRLANEDIELSSTLAAMNSEAALIHFFSGLKTELPSYMYSVYFSKVVEDHLFSTLKADPSRKMISAIGDLFIAQHDAFDQNDRLKEIIRLHFSGPTQIDKSLKHLYTSTAWKDFQSFYTIATFANPSFIDFLAEEIKKRKLKLADVRELELPLQGTANPHLAYFQNKFGTKIKTQYSEKQGKEKALETNKRNLKAIFDSKMMIKEVQQIYSAFGKPVLSEADRRSHTPSYYDTSFCEAARTQINLEKARAPVSLTSVEDYVNSGRFKEDLPYRVHAYLMRHGDAELSAPQLSKINRWCNQTAKTINFATAITSDGNGRTSIDHKANVFSYFLRRYKRYDYPETLYLDMLVFRKHLDSLAQVIDFVQEAIGLEKTRNRILENLIDDSIPIIVYLDYVEWLLRLKVEHAIPLLPLYFKRGLDTGNSQVLNTYLGLGGKIGKLKTILKSSTGYFRDELVEKFVSQGGRFIKNYLRREFENTTDPAVKLRLSNQLIRLQDSKGLAFYLSLIKHSASAPNDDYVTNPLYSLHKIKFLTAILDTYELSQQPGFEKPGFWDFSTICLAAIQNIALHGDHYPKFTKRLKQWIQRRKKEAKPPISQDIINTLAFILETVTNRYYTNKTPVNSIEDALGLFQHREMNDAIKFKPS